MVKIIQDLAIRVVQAFDYLTTLHKRKRTYGCMYDIYIHAYVHVPAIAVRSND